MTLTQILAYANVLTEDAFESLSDCLEFLNDAQDIIARYEMVQAAPVSYVLTTNQIILPVDFMKFHKATLNDVDYIPPESDWNGILALETSLIKGTIKLWYYKIPAVLVLTTQTPEVNPVYHRSIATYAAKMFNLVDDDPALREAYKNEFYLSLSQMKIDHGFAIKYKNL